MIDNPVFICFALILRYARTATVPAPRKQISRPAAGIYYMSVILTA